MELSLNGEEVKFEEETPYESGTRIIDVTYAPDFTEDGHVRGFVATLKDITSKKETEKNYKLSNASWRKAQHIMKSC